MEKGYILCAVGEKYVKESEIAVTSLRRFDPNAHVTIVTDVVVTSPLFDNVINIPIEKKDHQGIKLYKPKGLLLSPYEKTFYIDTDIYFCDLCDELFDLLDYFDLLVAHDVADMIEPVWKGKKLKGLYPYNNGMFVYRKNEKTDYFLKSWIDILETEFEANKHGQSSFVLAMMDAKLVSYTLTQIYNFRAVFYQGIPKTKVKIIHARDIDFAAFEKIINVNTKSRMWHPSEQRLIYNKPKTILQKIKRKFASVFNAKSKI